MREAGVKRADGKYAPSSQGAPLALWRGPNCEHPKSSPYVKLFWFGSLVWDMNAEVKETCYFGHGDRFFFSSAGSLNEGLCLGFAHTQGHPYGVLAWTDDPSEVILVKQEAFRGLPLERQEPETAKAEEVLAKHLACDTEKAGTWFSCVTRRLC
jgi:hypothetical protein